MVEGSPERFAATISACRSGTGGMSLRTASTKSSSVLAVSAVLLWRSNQMVEAGLPESPRAQTEPA